MAYAVAWIPWFLGVYAESQPGFEHYAALFNFSLTSPRHTVIRELDPCPLMGGE
jgi:hypothetical protein